MRACSASSSSVAGRSVRWMAKLQPSLSVSALIAARWLGLPPSAGRFFYCRPASVGVLGYEHKSRDEPIPALWNQIVRPRD